ncbi:helix-turn-helix domain-containing protein [Intestinibacter sp.]|uniref:helix-turn-helix domain-containing protein n=1 Tax=Intestinibacter sp. TaxID=1965304 RepID=UPI002A74E809|nr:helix-turn-helix transcriptional regulator [Intestinibacter sp.]MDY2737459.1 helix-turn-helix transcriptional regulator [Intestinibacter sp.]MDY4573933.1 helix-turn-helix transcriptional regulator [Intestinibacter sp.]
MNILSLGEKIKKLRKEKNMTLKELAGDRITAAQISHIERDKSHTSYELLEYLAERLDVSIDYLLETKEMQSKKITDNLILQSEIYIKRDALDEAEKEIEEIIEICEKYDLSENYGKCNYLLGNIYLKRKDSRKANFYFEKALFHFIKNDDKKRIFQCYMNIANIYFEDKFYQVALTNYYFAKEILDEINVDEPDTYKELYSKISKCYIKMDDTEKALEFIEKIGSIDNEYSPTQEVEMLVLKAKNLLAEARYIESKEYFAKALKIIEKEENKDKLAQVYLTVGSIYGEMGDNEKFLEYSEKVYDIKKNDSDEYMMDSLFNIIKSYIDSNEFELAKKYSKLALAAAIKTKSKYNEFRALKYYCDIYKYKGETDISIEYLIKCIEIVSKLDDDKILGNLYIELGQLYSGVSKEKELECYQKGVSIFKKLEII